MTVTPAPPPAPSPTDSLPAEHRGVLKANELRLKDSVIIGLASSGPTLSIVVTLAALVAATSYAGPVTILVCFFPMLGIAYAYKRLNQWHVNCGGPYVWAGRAISPMVGFMVGWLMLLAYLIGTISDVIPIGPYLLDLVAPSQVNSAWGAALSGGFWVVITAIVAYVGIRATVRFQWILAGFEYTVVFAFAIVALIAVFGGNSKSVPFHWSWFSWHTLGGTSGLVAGILIAVYLYSGWDTPLYLNEETRHARVTPGRAVMIGVTLLAFMYSFLVFAFQGAVKPAALQAHGADALAYIVKSIVGSPWDKIMVAAALMSMIASTQTAMVGGSRIAFAMGDDGVLPSALARIHPRFRTPSVATGLFAVVTFGALWLYLFGSASVAKSFTNVVSTTGLFFTLFYAFTGIAMVAFYRRVAFSSITNVLSVVIVPLASAGFLLWVAYKAVPGLGGWTGGILESVYVMLGIGLILMFIGRYVTRSKYFETPREKFEPRGTGSETIV